MIEPWISYKPSLPPQVYPIPTCPLSQANTRPLSGPRVFSVLLAEAIDGSAGEGLCRVGGEDEKHYTRSEKYTKEKPPCQGWVIHYRLQSLCMGSF